jgi:1,4-alpha-glucan branching enzyme
LTIDGIRVPIGCSQWRVSASGTGNPFEKPAPHRFVRTPIPVFSLPNFVVGDMTAPETENRVASLLALDPLLRPYRAVLARRIEAAAAMAARLTRGRMALADVTAGHEYFGLHRDGSGWVFREWAPNATAIHLVCDRTDWKPRKGWELQRTTTDGEWSLQLPADRLAHGDCYRLRVQWLGGEGDRIPAWARRVVQDAATGIFNAQVWWPEKAYDWQCPDFRRRPGPLLIYEAHVGMAQPQERVGTYREFRQSVLPRISAAGYNTLQLMALPEHPYYGSFGYHVSSFFAAASRFGPPEDLKALIDAAHQAGLAVIMDIVHSHAVANQVEGLSHFDGTEYQYFHAGERGTHPAWGSRCFDYAKPQVLHFLLSNCRYWLDEFRVDGFRFDGVTSMLYHHHGLGKAFTGYDDYFGDDVDEDALAYLTLANDLIHRLRPDAITIAEDVSGLPGLATPLEMGGSGFDCRFAMGVPDYWIKLAKDTADEHWPLGHLWYELNNRRCGEATISYAESHDQALVGDQTLISRLAGEEIYTGMQVGSPSLRVDRAVALHKLIRLATLATAGAGYLNFMGNEFGHPEWIDFPREGNGWSYRYARRQWHLADDPGLRYSQLGRFDRAMLALAAGHDLLQDPAPRLLVENAGDKVLVFHRADLIFAFSFHPTRSFTGYAVPAPPGGWRLVLDSDAEPFGGHGRVAPDQQYWTLPDAQDPDSHNLHLYLPTRTVLVLAAD